MGGIAEAVGGSSVKDAPGAVPAGRGRSPWRSGFGRRADFSIPRSRRRLAGEGLLGGPAPGKTGIPKRRLCGGSKHNGRIPSLDGFDGLFHTGPLENRPAGYGVLPSILSVRGVSAALGGSASPGPGAKLPQPASMSSGTSSLWQYASALWTAMPARSSPCSPRDAPARASVVSSTARTLSSSGIPGAFTGSPPRRGFSSGFPKQRGRKEIGPKWRCRQRTGFPPARTA